MGKWISPVSCTQSGEEFLNVSVDQPAYHREQPRRFCHPSGPCLTDSTALPGLLKNVTIGGHLPLISLLFSQSLIGFGRNNLTPLIKNCGALFYVVVMDLAFLVSKSLCDSPRQTR